MKNLDELIQNLREQGLLTLANDLAITKYKAHMWDKYQREARISKDLQQALEVTQEALDLEDALRDAAASELAKQTDAMLNPHAHDDFMTKDASGAVYTGHDEEDIPGTARKGEN